MPGFRTPWEALDGEDEKLEGQTERVQPRVEGQESSRLCQKWLPLTSEFTAEQYLLGLFLKLCCFGLLQLPTPPHYWKEISRIRTLESKRLFPEDKINA